MILQVKMNILLGSIKNFIYNLFVVFPFNFIFKTSFPFWQARGFHLIRNYRYFEPIPDTRTLKNKLWRRQSKLVGISVNLPKQLKLLSMFSRLYRKEYDKFPLFSTGTSYEYFINNGGFQSVDGEILYSFVRHFKPKRIIEIGSGNSTLLMVKAGLLNRQEGYPLKLTVIDPYPNQEIKLGSPGLFKLIISKVEDIPINIFKMLKKDDILFIDSSHILKIGGDVWYEYLEIMPVLSSGVIIQIHDIFLPAEYPKDLVLKKYYFWSEQYLLQAFLSFNSFFEILWMSSLMHLKYQKKLEDAFPSYVRTKKTSWPASFWIRRV